mmetsp:Transcript_11185/g.17574  ORF Transcript_11185/g.17574 Transcript_11185/m.17574 type:complete len:269 (-) Transcript_11185:38-844(-)
MGIKYRSQVSEPLLQDADGLLVEAEPSPSTQQRPQSGPSPVCQPKLEDPSAPPDAPSVSEPAKPEEAGKMARSEVPAPGEACLRPLPVGGIAPSEEVPECRICKGGEDEGPLVKVCRCRGSCQWVHRVCLQKWLESRPGSSLRGYAEGQGPRPELRCEVCGSPYDVKVESRLEWAPRRLISYRSCEAYFECLSLAGTISMLGAIPFLVWRGCTAEERQTLRDNWAIELAVLFLMAIMSFLAFRKMFIRWRRLQLIQVINIFPQGTPAT